MLWRINHVSKIKAKSCPVLWVYGGVAKLDPEDTLYDLVHGGFYTCTLGYMGLYECVKYLTGHGHWEEENGAKNLANKILDYLNKQNKEFGNEVNVSIALYGSPGEVLTDKFAKACVEKFGHVGDGTVRDYLTNSYHIPVFKNTNAFDKLSIEAEFSDKTAGGSISYVELPNMSNNIEAVLELIEHIGDTCLYAELNSKFLLVVNADLMAMIFLKFLQKTELSDGNVRDVEKQIRKSYIQVIESVVTLVTIHQIKEEVRT